MFYLYIVIVVVRIGMFAAEHDLYSVHQAMDYVRYDLISIWFLLVELFIITCSTWLAMHMTEKDRESPSA
ncbi:hypothetical protein F2S72_01460 [Pseudomonas syringae pv. actinidiae]|nr:hypothetical protein [Pseudomonas syringae pv. actinidiae]